MQACERDGRRWSGGRQREKETERRGEAERAAATAREYALGAPGTERPYGPETASVAAEGKEEKRHFRQSHCHDSATACVCLHTYLHE